MDRSCLEVNRIVFLLTAGAATVGAVAWPVGTAFSTGMMTPRQAQIQKVPVVRKAPPPQQIGQLIVKLRNISSTESRGPLDARRMNSLSTKAGVTMRGSRPMSGGASIVALGAALPLDEARVVAARLAQDPEVEYAVPDILLRKAVVPTETRFTEWQWNLFAPTSSYTGNVQGGGTKTAVAIGASNLPLAWDLTTGSSAVIVAVVDSGIANHPDLNGTSGGATYVPGGRMLPGYDFTSGNVGAPTLPANFVANDGDGRDADPSDPGDWISAKDKTDYPGSCGDGQAGQTDSSWHGTHMAGIVGATANNALGIAGIGWNVRMVPVRALGKCGGSTSDIADAIRWSAGLTVAGAPANANPAQVISLSLGASGACTPPLQSAVTDAINAGAVVVAATGNDGNNQIGQPANCSGVIAVSAHTINGESADYSNVGPGTSISAPGGGRPFLLGAGGATDDPMWNGFYIWSTLLFGLTGPTSSDTSNPPRSGPAYAGFTGTSPATPHVAAVAGLIKSVLPAATPAQIRSHLISSVRPFPTGSVCAAGGAEAGQCGAGLLDARLALLAAGPEVAPTAAAGVDQIVAPSTIVTLSGAASSAFTGKTLNTYRWTQTAGPLVTLSSPNAATTTFVAPATGSVTLQLRVTDSNGKFGDDLVRVQVNSPPVLAATTNVAAVSGGVVTFNVAASDVDGDPLTVVATTASTVPMTTLSPAGQFIWNTAGIPAGSYQLVYFATDGFAQSTTQSVTITLSPSGSAANSPSSGGGGALPLSQFLLLLLLASARIQRRHDQPE